MKTYFNKEGISFLIFGFVLLLSLLTKNIVKVFEPLYSKIYYGQINDLFNNVLSLIYLIIIFIVFIKVFHKITNLKFRKEEDKKELSSIRIVVLIVMTLIPILIVGGCLGWELKIIYDLGEKFNMSKLLNVVSNYVISIIKMLFVTYAIVSFNNFFEKCFEFENKKISTFVPFAGVLIMLTFGLVELILGVNQLNVLYFVFSLYYGVVYLVTDKSTSKTMLITTLIYLF